MAFNRFVGFNKRFVTICACWCSLNREFGLPMNLSLSIFENTTLLWSFLIFITSLHKFFYFNQEKSTKFTAAISENPFEQRQAQLRDLLLLNYLPHINQFGKLYYGLVSVAIGAPLSWRLYLCFYKPLTESHSFKQRRRLETKRDLVQFFSNGSGVDSGRPEGGLIRRSRELLHTIWQEVSNNRTQSATDGDGQQTIVWRKRRVGYLARLHHQTLDGRLMADDNPGEKRRESEQTYTIPVREQDFFADYSKIRWLRLARGVYLFYLMASIFGYTVLWYAGVGFHSVMRTFTWDDGASDLSPLATTLKFYGLLEQMYTCTQGAIFFVYTLIFITLFYADIIYKFKTIRNDLSEVLTSCGDQSEYEEPSLNQQHDTLVEIRFKQLRIWAFFDHIDLLDSFVSIYSVVSMITFIIGVSFGHSLLKVEDPLLQVATTVVLAGNFISFAYLYVISYDIERKMYKTLCAILARESDLDTKRNWQKLLIAFYGIDSKRTFTLYGRYALNFRALFKIMFTVITTSIVVNKFFHRRAWENFTRMSSKSALANVSLSYV